MIGPFILMYHSIDDDSRDPYSVSVNDFRQQMLWLVENGFDIVPLSSLVETLQNSGCKSLRKKVVLTFDDGYQDFVANALPVLLDFKMPATVFLVTHMLGEKASWDKNGAHVQLMSEEEARYIKAQGINLGSHTSAHANLILLNREDLQRQLGDSYKILESLGESFMAFSYPWGQWSSETAEFVKSFGYTCALAVGERTRLAASNIFCLPRITMVRNRDLMRFQALLTRTRIGMELRRRYRIMREVWPAAALKISS